MARFEGLTQWSSLGNFESFLVVGSVSAVIAVHFGWAFLHPEPLLELEPEVLSSRPLIFRLPQLLNAAECAELISLGKPQLVASLTGAAETSPSSPDGWRNSSTVTLDGGAHPLAARLRRRLSVAARLQSSHAEPLQLARYKPGEQYGLHLDVDPLGAVPRYATMLVYLNDGFGGGHTVFPRVGRGGGGTLKPLQKLAAAGGDELLWRELGRAREFCASDSVLRVPPRRGDALLFFTLGRDATVDWDLAHGGCPPTSGAKWVAQQWWTLDPAQAQPPEDGAAAALPAAKGGEALARHASARALERMRAEMRGEG